MGTNFTHRVSGQFFKYNFWDKFAVRDIFISKATLLEDIFHDTKMLGRINMIKLNCDLFPWFSYCQTNWHNTLTNYLSSLNLLTFPHSMTSDYHAFCLLWLQKWQNLTNKQTDCSLASHSIIAFRGMISVEKICTCIIAYAKLTWVLQSCVDLTIYQDTLDF